MPYIPTQLLNICSSVDLSYQSHPDNSLSEMPLTIVVMHNNENAIHDYFAR